MKDPPDPQCADRPYKTNLTAKAQGNLANQLQTEKQFESDENGKFSVDLPAGEYIISSSDTASFFSHCLSQGTIKVEKNKYTDITLRCDTGIR